MYVCRLGQQPEWRSGWTPRDVQHRGDFLSCDGNKTVQVPVKVDYGELRWGGQLLGESTQHLQSVQTAQYS
jgi:hypothetical protein